MTENHKILSLISIAQKAGKVVSGEFTSENAVKTGKASLALVAEDASPNTKKHFTDLCSYYKVPLRFIATKDELGQWTGKGYRACLCILDTGFADALLKRLES